MLRLVIRRVVWAIPILIGVATLTFFISRALPGDPARIFAGTQANESTVNAIRAQYGLDKPLGAQYVDYMRDLVSGDFGSSIRTGNEVLSELINRTPATLELIIAALLIALLVGVPLGIAGAVKPRSWIGAIGRTVSTIGIATPEFWLGLLLIVIFYVGLGVAAAPVGRLDIGMSPPPTVTGMHTIDALLALDFGLFANAFAHLMLPALALGFPAMGPIIRLTMNATATALRSEYISYSKAIGTPPLPLYGKHVLKNVAPVVITMTALIFGFMVGGAVVVEEVFSWPGVGLFAVDSLHFNDYAAVQGFVLLSASMYILLFVAADIANAALDPRKRL